MEEFLKPTVTIESNHPEIIEIADSIANFSASPQEKAISFFYFVRDNIKYDPLSASFSIEDYRASRILEKQKGYCVQKAVLLASLLRSAGIPARLAFADIINHLASENLVRLIGSNLFVYHGYVEIYLDERWIKATPTFEKEVCLANGFPIVDFDGKKDATFPPLNDEGKPFVEYVKHHGSFEDVPLEKILKAWEEAYGKDRIEFWKKALGR